MGLRVKLPRIRSMGRNRFFFNQKVLTPAQQRYCMGLHWPGFAALRSGQVVAWTGQLQPAAIGNSYTVRITYTPPRRPQVEVLEPKLASRPGERIPHTFPGERLCLHLAGEWDAGKIIAQTIVHWTAFWLYFYETWLITGKWEGGGHEPESSKSNE